MVVRVGSHQKRERPGRDQDECENADRGEGPTQSPPSGPLGDLGDEAEHGVGVHVGKGRLDGPDSLAEREVRVQDDEVLFGNHHDVDAYIQSLHAHGTPPARVST